MGKRLQRLERVTHPIAGSPKKTGIKKRTKGASPMKLSSTALLALAISSITANAYADPASQDFVPTTLAGTSAQSEAKGFIDGASLGGTTRN